MLKKTFFKDCTGPITLHQQQPSNKILFTVSRPLVIEGNTKTQWPNITLNATSNSTEEVSVTAKAQTTRIINLSTKNLEINCHGIPIHYKFSPNCKISTLIFNQGN